MPNWQQYKRGLLGIRNEHYSKTVVPQARVITLFSTPLQIIPATPGYMILPFFLHMRKLAGAYTLNGSTIISCQVGGGVTLAATEAGFLDQAGELIAISFGPGNTVGLYPNYGPSTPASFGGVPMTLTVNTANLSGAGGDLEVTVLFYSIPIIMAY